MGKFIFAYKLEQDEQTLLPDLSIPLTFKSIKNNSTVKLNRYSANENNYQVDTTGIQYRKSLDGNWIKYNFNGKNGTEITLNENEIVQFRNVNKTFSLDKDNYFKFKLSGELECEGDLNSMIYYEDDLPDYAFYCLFHSCSSLYVSPIIKSNSLGNYSLGELFYNCSNLTTIYASLKDWGTNLDTSTERWVYGVFKTGKFICSDELFNLYDNHRYDHYEYQSIDRYPIGWNIVNSINNDEKQFNAVNFELLSVTNAGIEAANTSYEVIGYNTKFNTRVWSNGIYNILYYGGYWLITSQKPDYFGDYNPTDQEYYAYMEGVQHTNINEPYEMTNWSRGTGSYPIPSVELMTM